ncbi:MAG: hypothetical protein D4R66_04515 [Opitutales bacterium]|nr:MAG: hypothetical protein D4R66_04515 [Opitutales bacterium]
MMSWRNGEWFPQPDGAEVSVIHPGPCLFETFAIRDGKVACLGDHLARLALGCPRLGLDAARLQLGAKAEVARWQPVIRQLLAREKLTDAILRLIVAPRADALPTEWLTARALPPTPSTIDLFQLRTERDQPEWHPRPKSGPWRNSSAAWRELKSRTPRLDVEGLQFDALGRLAEATRSSLAWWDGQVWSFPAAATGRLLGTAAAQFRGVLIQAGCSVQDVAEGFPQHAQALVVLRSTFSGGAVLAHKYVGLDGTTLWQASANQDEPQRHLLALAQWRSQRAIILA